MKYSCENCYHHALNRVDEEPCVNCKQRSHFLPEPEYSRQAILALEKELKTKYGYDDERINQIIDEFLVKVEINRYTGEIDLSNDGRTSTWGKFDDSY